VKTLTQYLLFVAALGVCLLAFLRPSAISEFLVTLLFVSPAYVLFERGRVGLGVVVLFVGLVAAAVVLKIALRAV
jgi:hypothetical protein